MKVTWIAASPSSALRKVCPVPGRHYGRHAGPRLLRFIRKPVPRLAGFVADKPQDQMMELLRFNRAAFTPLPMNLPSVKASSRRKRVVGYMRERGQLRRFFGVPRRTSAEHNCACGHRWAPHLR